MTSNNVKQNLRHNLKKIQYLLITRLSKTNLAKLNKPSSPSQHDKSARQACGFSARVSVRASPLRSCLVLLLLVVDCCAVACVVVVCVVVGCCANYWLLALLWAAARIILYICCGISTLLFWCCLLVLQMIHIYIYIYI